MPVICLIHFCDYIEGKLTELPFSCTDVAFVGVMETLCENPSLRAKLREAATLILEHKKLEFIRDKIRPSKLGRTQSHSIDEVNEQIYKLIPCKDKALKEYEMMRRLWAYDIQALIIKG